MVRIGKYTSAPQQCQFSITFKQGNTADVRSLLQFSFLIKYVYTVRSYYEQDQVNDKWCRKKKGNAEIQFSVFVSITRIIDLLFWHFLRRYFCLFQRSLKPKKQNHRLSWARKSSILLISVPGEGRNPLSSERFLTFIRT